jgi:hypothetical protein
MPMALALECSADQQEYTLRHLNKKNVTKNGLGLKYIRV